MSSQAPRRVVLVASMLVVAACGGGDTAVPSVIDLDPAPSDQVIVSVDRMAGFVPEIEALRMVPVVIVHGDGRVLQDVSEPLDSGERPAEPIYEERRLTEDGLDRLVSRLDEAGVTEEVDFGEPPITDLDTLRVQVVLDRQRIVNSVYAPGFDEGIPEPQRAARRQIDDLVEDLSDLDALLGDDISEPTDAEFDRWLAFTEFTDRDPSSGPGNADAILSQGWPIDEALAASGEAPIVCAELEGAELATMLDAARSQFAETLWELVTGNGVDLVLRPVFGDESCADYPEFVAR